jgi:hypothetical protein
MKTILKFLVVAFMAIFGFGLGLTTAWASGDGMGSPEIVRNPTVPIEIFKMGRQEVFRHLLLSVREIRIEITGRSVVTQDYDNVLSHDELENRGYKFNGSFSDLSEVIRSYEYHVKVILMANGRYDVSMKIRYIDSEGNTALLGNSWLAVAGKGGDLFSNAQPWVYMPENVNMSFPGNDQYRLKWFSGRYDDVQPIEFWTWADKEGSMMMAHDVPTSKLGYGYLSVSGPNGKLSVINLSNGGYEVEPADLFVLMDKSLSPMLEVIDNPKTGMVWNVGAKAYQIGNGIYGRVPMLEVINVGTRIDEWVDFSVQVGESMKRIHPFNVKVISLDDGKTVFIERADNGRWHLQLEKGVSYQILVDYGDQIIDWSAGPALG